MAVATPVLERQTLQNAQSMSADELHNAQIKENYKRLINPDFGIREVRGEATAAQPVKAAAQTFEEKRASILQPVRPVREETVRPVQAEPRMGEEREARPYLVTNARADAEIFRADSAVNRRYAADVRASDVEDEENEDLVPTRTTIQYKTLEESDRYAAKAVSKESETHILGKREKIIIATFISVVVALFVLVIVNSAVIAGLNSELAVVANGVTAAREALAEVTAQIDAATSLANIADYAGSHGLILA